MVKSDVEHLRTDVAQYLRDSANSIEAGYWFRGTHGRDDSKQFIVLADGTVLNGNLSSSTHGRSGGCLFTATMWHKALDAIQSHFGVDNAESIYLINDNQELETGRQWAIDTLRKVADRVERGEIVV